MGGASCQLMTVTERLHQHMHVPQQGQVWPPGSRNPSLACVGVAINAADSRCWWWSSSVLMVPLGNSRIKLSPGAAQGGLNLAAHAVAGGGNVRRGHRTVPPSAGTSPPGTAGAPCSLIRRLPMANLCT